MAKVPFLDYESYDFALIAGPFFTSFNSVAGVFLSIVGDARPVRVSRIRPSRGFLLVVLFLGLGVVDLDATGGGRTAAFGGSDEERRPSSHLNCPLSGRFTVDESLLSLGLTVARGTLLVYP